MHVFLTSSIFDTSGFYSSNYTEEYGAQTRGAKEKKIYQEAQTEQNM